MSLWQRQDDRFHTKPPHLFSLVTKKNNLMQIMKDDQITCQLSLYLAIQQYKMMKAIKEPGQIAESP